MAAGVVYALRNSSLPGVLKIGGSRYSASTRAKQLSRTGVPDDYSVVWEQPVSDWKAAETLAHRKLGAWRYRLEREFFRVSERQVIDILKAVALEYPSAGASVGSGAEVMTVGATVPARIVSCNGAGLEVLWNVPEWMAPAGGRNFGEVPEVPFHFAGNQRSPKFIPHVLSIDIDDRRWAVCSAGRLLEGSFDAPDAPVKISLYRKEDAHRPRLVQLVASFHKAESAVRAHDAACLDASNNLLGSWGRGYKEADARRRKTGGAQFEIVDTIERLVADPTRWKPEERRGFWLYKSKVHEVLRTDVQDEEAAILVQHHAEHERARLRRLREEAVRLAAEDE